MSTERMSDEAFEAVDPFVIDGTAALLAEARRARAEEARLADERASVVAQRDEYQRAYQEAISKEAADLTTLRSRCDALEARLKETEQDLHDAAKDRDHAREARELWRERCEKAEAARDALEAQAGALDGVLGELLARADVARTQYQAFVAQTCKGQDNRWHDANIARLGLSIAAAVKARATLSARLAESEQQRAEAEALAEARFQTHAEFVADHAQERAEMESLRKRVAEAEAQAGVMRAVLLAAVGANNGEWWCPRCAASVPSAQVTNDEHHERCGAYLGYQDGAWEKRAHDALKADAGRALLDERDRLRAENMALRNLAGQIAMMLDSGQFPVTSENIRAALAIIPVALSPDDGRQFAERLERAERALREIRTQVESNEAEPENVLASIGHAARAALAPEAARCDAEFEGHRCEQEMGHAGHHRHSNGPTIGGSVAWDRVTGAEAAKGGDK